MRDSFFHLKEWYMATERPDDFELVRDYVAEQTRKVSMEQIGVDLTMQDTGDFQRSASASLFTGGTRQNWRLD